MKKAALIVLQLALAVLVGLGVRELWLASTGDDAADDRAPETMAVVARVTPDVHTFGEPVRATVEVVADAGFIKPETVRVETDFAPYELDGEPAVERDRRQRCRAGRLPRTRCGVSARAVTPPRHAALRSSSPDSSTTGTSRGRARGDTFSTGRRSRSPRGSPRRTSRPFAGARARRRCPRRPCVSGLSASRWLCSRSPLALVAAAALLGRRLWRSEADEDVQQAHEARTPLERALELVLADTQNGSSSQDRRRTLERLARELTAVGHPGLAADARELAWSPGSASSDEVSGLAGRVADAVGMGVA